MGSGSNLYQIGNKIRYMLKVLHRKGISMLTNLKLSSLTCKCLFHRPELNAKASPMELNFGSLEMKHTNG